jgi:hypothetical protein
MFGFFKKSKKDLSNSDVAFDLKPLYESLTSSQKVHFNNLANNLHFEIHKFATIKGLNSLCKSFLVKKKFEDPEILSPNLYSFYEHDEELKRHTFEIFYPFNEFSSVKALRHLVDERYPENDILSMISGEAAIRVIKGEFFHMGSNSGNLSAADDDIQVKEDKSHNNSEKKHNSGIEINQITNIVEKNDKAVHRRADISLDEKRKKIIEKNDRAVHGRSEFESNSESANNANINDAEDSNNDAQSESLYFCKKEWLGISIKCPACECKFIVDKTMIFYSYGVRCPQCNQKIII